MFMRYTLILVLAGLGLSFAPRASAASFGCESVSGSVIFKDTLYGVLTGSVLTGLYILAQDKDDRKNTDKTLTAGAAVGGALGFGLGITEVAMRDCPGTRFQSSEVQKGFSSSFAAVPTTDGNLGAGWRMSWRF
jgi:hypothetical protein